MVSRSPRSGDGAADRCATFRCAKGDQFGVSATARDEGRHARRFSLHYGFEQLPGGMRTRAGWVLSRQKHEQEHAQSINIGCGGDWFAGDLFWRRILRGQG